MTDNFDYKEYARQMRENSVVENGIVKVSKNLWYQIADIIDDNGNLINRQKAEIERLEYCNSVNVSSIGTLHERLKEAKSEAIKEFAERLKEESCSIILYGDIVPVNRIERVIKEMVVALDEIV